MGSCALRFLSESLSLGIGLPLCLTPLLRSEDWERSSHWQQSEYLFSMAPGRRRPCLDRGRCRDSQSGTGHNRIECLRRAAVVSLYGKPRYAAGRFQAQGWAHPHSHGKLDCNRQPNSPWSNDWRGCGCFRWFGGFEGCPAQLPRSREPRDSCV